MESTTVTAPKKAHCHFKLPEGQRCQTRPRTGGRHCLWPEPSKATARKEAGCTGGRKGRARTLPVETADFNVSDASSVVELLSKTVNKTLRGEIDTKEAKCAVGYLAGVTLKAREQGEIDERAAKIEEILKVLGGRIGQRVLTRHSEGSASP